MAKSESAKKDSGDDEVNEDSLENQKKGSGGPTINDQPTPFEEDTQDEAFESVADDFANYNQPISVNKIISDNVNILLTALGLIIALMSLFVPFMVMQMQTNVDSHNNYQQNLINEKSSKVLDLQQKLNTLIDAQMRALKERKDDIIKIKEEKAQINKLHADEIKKEIKLQVLQELVKQQNRQGIIPIHSLTTNSIPHSPITQKRINTPPITINNITNHYPINKAHQTKVKKALPPKSSWNTKIEKVEKRSSKPSKNTDTFESVFGRGE